ncbi:hypothetical protein, unknown function [Leishmania tarentolae]|uniref:Uncharacterized protein n=1 Tax=Leishmania tarentolae TaxID=5689 RepID=A0A640KTB0_LEITA|nr:hypothetical protein, unknown function [Leishmania tarentolae]
MSLYSEIVSDQLPAAVSAVRSHFSKWNPSQIARIVFTEFIFFLRKYWAWAMYFIILRKLYRILSRTDKRSSKSNRIKKSSASIPDNNESVTDLETTPRAVDVSFFTENAEFAPSKNQMIVGDGVIVINRNDRYVEVYERRNVAKVGNVEAEVKALLKEFAACSNK